MDSEKANRTYDSTIRYDGKWVLYRDYASNEYSSIFVIEERDGIMKFVYETIPDRIYYKDVEDFKFYNRFFINPIQEACPKIAVKKMTPEDDYDDDYSERGLLSRWVNANDVGRAHEAKSSNFCSHDWQYSDLLSYPPIHTRRCLKCRREEFQPRNSDDWIEGNGYS